MNECMKNESECKYKKNQQSGKLPLFEKLALFMLQFPFLEIVVFPLNQVTFSLTPGLSKKLKVNVLPTLYTFSDDGLFTIPGGQSGLCNKCYNF